MATGDTTDITTRLRLSLPKQWFQTDGTVIGAILGALSTSWAWAYSLYAYIKVQSRILTATDGWLDVVAGDFFGTSVTRKASQSDASFRAAIIINLFRERATRKAIITVLTQLTGRAPVIIEPQRPADTGAYGAAVAVTRSTIASYYDASGVLQYAPPNQVRYSYNPANLAAGATLLIEAAATNFFIGSIGLVIGWATDGLATVVPNASAAPDGTITASQLQFISNTYIYQNKNLTAGVTYTHSLHVKLGTGGSGLISMHDSTGGNSGTFNLNAGSVSGSSGCVASIVSVGSGWFRCAISFAPAATGTHTLDFVQLGTFSAGQGHYIWGAQLEPGPVATSVIPTTSAAATRSADVLLSNMTPGSAAPGGYGQAGAYGSQLIPYQAFVRAYRPAASGIPMIAGYGNAPAAYGIASQGGEYASINMVQGAVQDVDIYAAIDAVKPVGSTMWTQISS
jgi:hypothetical protein